MLNKAASLLNAPEAGLIRIGVARFIQLLPNLYALHGRNVSDYMRSPMVVSPITDFASYFQPEVEPAILRQLEALPTVAEGILKKKLTTNVPASFDIDVELIEWVEKASKMLKVSKADFIRAAVVHFIYSLPELYQQRGRDYIAYDDAAVTVPKMITRAVIEVPLKGRREENSIHKLVEHGTWKMLFTQSLHVLQGFLKAKPRSRKEIRVIEDAIVKSFVKSGSRDYTEVEDFCGAYSLDPGSLAKRLGITKPQPPTS